VRAQLDRLGETAFLDLPLQSGPPDGRLPQDVLGFVYVVGHGSTMISYRPGFFSFRIERSFDSGFGSPVSVAGRVVT
jgi:hypothetical protein